VHAAEYVDASLETKEAEAYVASATAEIAELPSGLPVLGYEAISNLEALEESSDAKELSLLEDQAHAQKVLLSSDAMRYFTAKVAQKSDRAPMLDSVISKARVTFPSEDGWVVLNLVRMEQVMEEVNIHTGEVSNQTVALTPFESTVPMTAGSLAEAILGGNSTAAYAMISHRPMIALADAASDLDAVYRSRKGEVVHISHMLKTEAEKLSDGQLGEVLAALTSSLDGTYTDEESAVKMAIMKAIKAIG